MPAREPSFLAEASLLLSQSLDPDEALASLARIAVPAIADWCMIHVRRGEQVVLVALEVADPAKRETAREMIRRYPPDRYRVSGIWRVLEGAPAELYEDIADEVLVQSIRDPEQLAYTRSLGYRSAMAVPVVGRGAIVGAITFVAAESGRRYGPESLAVAEDLGRRAGLALENARLYAAERAARRAAECAADRLQRLYQLTLALSSVVDAREAAAIFVEAGGDALGATGGFAWLVDDAGAELEMVASRGFEGVQVDRFRRFALDAPIPLCDAIRDRQPRWFGSPDELHQLYPATIAASGSPFQSWATVPFVAGERAMGGVSFSFLEPQAFDAEQRALLDAMARQASVALERCRLFAAERRATAAARLAERRKDEFLAMLGHELRNPLAPLVTAIDLMRMRDPDAFVQEREVIERATAHLTRLIDDLLDVARITRGMVALTRSPLELAGVIVSAVEMASPLIERRRHRLEIDVAAGLRVDADPLRLAQVFQNLLTNAARYTPAGGHLAVRARRDGGEVVVQVIDDGTGIDAELLPAIFELFVQGARTRDRGEGGLGLGLTLVKRLVELHGGSVVAASEGPGRGATMTVRLPAIDHLTAAPAPAPAPRLDAGARRVLVVDDNRDAAEMLAEILRNLGYVVATAADGPSALALAPALRPQIAVLDIGLPVMDGYELARRLREERRELLLIAVTGYGQEDDVARSLAAGFDHHLVKPVDLRALEAALSAPRRGASAGP